MMWILTCSFRRVGFGQEKETITHVIPACLPQLHRDFKVIEETPTAPPWDFVWNAVVEEGREKRLLGQAFIANMNMEPALQLIESEQFLLAEAALKVGKTYGTHS